MKRFVVMEGKVGSAVAMKLIARGCRVTSLSQKEPKNVTLSRVGVRQISVGFADVEAMAEAMEGSDGFFLATAVAEEMRLWGFSAVEAARRAGVAKIVRSSALGASAASATRLGHWHHAIDEAIKASALPYVILQPNLFFQNFLSFGIREQIRTKSEMRIPGGEGKVSWVDVNDVADAATTALLRRELVDATLVLTGPEALSFRQTSTLLSQVLQRPIRWVDVAESETRTYLSSQLGLPTWKVSVFTEMFEALRSGLLSTVTEDLPRLVGHHPRTFTHFAIDNSPAFELLKSHRNSKLESQHRKQEKNSIRPIARAASSVNTEP